MVFVVVAAAPPAPPAAAVAVAVAVPARSRRSGGDPGTGSVSTIGMAFSASWIPGVEKSTGAFVAEITGQSATKSALRACGMSRSGKVNGFSPRM